MSHSSIIKILKFLYYFVQCTAEPGKEGGHCKEVAIMERLGHNLTPVLLRGTTLFLFQNMLIYWHIIIVIQTIKIYQNKN